MDWIEVKIYTESEGIEALCARLMDLGAGAVQIEDPKEMAAFIQANTNPKNWDYVEDELLNIQGKDTYVQVYLTNDEDGLRLLENISLAMDEMRLGNYGINMGSLRIEQKIVSDENWIDNWKKYYKPFELGRNIVIKPEWEEYENSGNKTVFTINPGHLFGTGLHQSTQLCVEQLENYVNSESDVLDLGCGSGILSIISLLLKAKSAYAVDIEPGCIKVVNENAGINSIPDGFLTVKSGNLLTDLRLREDIAKKKYGIITANIVADVIIELAPFAADVIKKDGVFISSGIIDERLSDVKKGLESAGFEIIDVFNKDVWACVAAKLV